MSTPHDTGHAAIREDRGRKVREAWVAYCLETGDTKPSHIAPWESLSEWDKEADRRIGDAVADALHAQLEASEARVERYRDAFDAVMVVLSGDASTEAWAAVGVTCADLRKHRDLPTPEES